ncbi:hypothetical protein ACIBI4_32485 [Streptomyces sp. NPDC050418]|uniref:hypothetical protein n=1 Tax=Streptomyces sp. NPDC050418 TaxID=3365612 RepID=UPI0037AA6780
MTMLNVLSRGYLPHVSFDAAHGDQELRAAADALAKRGDWGPARDLLLASDGDWAAKDHRVQYLADRAVGKAVLRQWAEAEPESGDPLAVLSRAEVTRAWGVRSARSAKYVRKDAWRRFYEILGQADELAALAGELAPDDPTPRATAVCTARGLQVSRSVFNERWDALVARDPLHWNGHRHALQYLCAKWYGSHKEMFAFARNAADAAPVGHPLVLLPLRANLEMRLADGNVGLGSGHFGMDLVRVQERWIEAVPQPHARIIDDRSLVAFYLCRMGRLTEAAVQFREMGRFGSTSGWCYTLFPRQSFLSDRAAALRLQGARQ